MFDFLKNNLASISVIIAFFGIIVPFFRYLIVRSAEINQNRFKNYHKLIRDLVAGDGTLYLDSQIAIIYELRLRKYRKYREVSIRILEGLKKTWIEPKNERLLNEISISLSKM